MIDPNQTYDAKSNSQEEIKSNLNKDPAINV